MSSTTGKSDHADCGSSRVMFPAERYGVAGDGAIPHIHHMNHTEGENGMGDGAH